MRMARQSRVWRVLGLKKLEVARVTHDLRVTKKFAIRQPRRDRTPLVTHPFRNGHGSRRVTPAYAIGYRCRNRRRRHSL